jgi:hypothetical protein
LPVRHGIQLDPAKNPPLGREMFWSHQPIVPL